MNESQTLVRKTNGLPKLMKNRSKEPINSGLHDNLSQNRLTTGPAPRLFDIYIQILCLVYPFKCFES
jgi:hypothetical protein